VVQQHCTRIDQGGGKLTRGGGHVISFVKAEHDLDGIHEGRFAVLIEYELTFSSLALTAAGSMIVLLRLPP